MFQLAYISTAKGPLDAATIGQILATSRRNNHRAGVTGLLVVGGRRFLQVLEGPEQAVLETFARIKGDERHRAFVTLACHVVVERAFGEWSMAYDGEAGLEDVQLQEKVAALVASIADPNLRAQFNGFAQLHGRAA